MKKALWYVSVAICLMGLLCCPASGQATNASDSVFAAKAKELTTGKASRMARLTALHTFVRDGVAQCQTQYG